MVFNSQEYLSQYAPDGSSLYYACLYHPKSEQEFIIALHGFYTELKQIHTQINDPGIARIKLAWWRQEIEKIQSNSSQHPLIHYLYNCTNKHTIDINLFNQIIDAEESLIQKHFVTDQEKISVYKKSIGTVWQLCCEYSKSLSNTKKDWIIQTATIIECLNNGFNFFENLRHDHCDLSDEYLNSKQIKRESLNSFDTKTLWHKLIKPYIETQYSQLDIQLQSKNNISTYLFPQILSQIYLARCKKVLKTNMPESNDILPIKKLFLAWKIHRRLRSS